MDTSFKGNARVRAYAEAHSAFLDLWTQGMPLVEIGVKLGLSTAQLQKHSLAAYNAKVTRPEPRYECLPMNKLPSIMRSMMLSDDGSALVKIEAVDDGLIVTLMPSRHSNSVTDAPLLPAVPTNDEACA